MINEVNFLKNAHSIRKVLNLSWDEYLEAFGMGRQEAEKHLLNPKEFPLKFAMNFCERFQLDLMNVFSEDFDVKSFARNHLCQLPQLPEKYQMERNSRVVTLINFVSGLENAGQGWLSELVFRRMQLPKSLLLYPEMAIPFKLIIDFLELVEKFRTDPQVMQLAGQEGINRLNEKLGLVSSHDDFSVEYYEKFFQEIIQSFDKSYDYKLVDSTSNQVTIQWDLKEEFQEIYKTKSISNNILLNYKSGIASGISTLFGLRPADIELMPLSKIKNEHIKIHLPKLTSTSGKILH